MVSRFSASNSRSSSSSTHHSKPKAVEESYLERSDDDDGFFKPKRKKAKGEHPLKNPDAVTDILGAVKKELRIVTGEQEQDDTKKVDNQEENESSPTVITSAADLLHKIKTDPPRLPSGTHRPKQTLSQNYLNDSKTVADIIRAFHGDATAHNEEGEPTTVGPIVELGPGIGALTDPLYQIFGSQRFRCIEIDERSVNILQKKHPGLRIHHGSVLDFDYRKLYLKEEQPLTIVGNLPYNITTKILLGLADSSARYGSIRSATVTMQWEVGQKILSRTHCKDYGILSVILQLYCHSLKCHFQIPPTVFYPQPSVYSCLMGFHFLQPKALQTRLAGVQPQHIRQVLDLTFQQRRKTVRNSLKNVYQQVYGEAEGKDRWLAALELNVNPPQLPDTIQQLADAGNVFAQQQRLPVDWASMRPEMLTPGQFVELTRLVHSDVTEVVRGEQTLGT